MSNRGKCTRLLHFALAGLWIALMMACDPPRDVTSDATSDLTPEAATGELINRSVADPEPLAPSLPVSGDVLLLGGWSKGNKSTATAEFFDPTTRKFRRMGSMTVSVAASAVALLNSGVPNTMVLVAGGFSGKSKFTRRTVSQSVTGSDPTMNNLQIFDTTTGEFMPANANLLMPRFGATATVLPSGKVVIAGGADSTGTPTNTAEVFDPMTGMTTACANNMSSPRAFHTATLLGDGTVLIAGGGTDKTGDLTNSADIYDPATNMFTATGAMTEARGAHAAVVLTNGPLTGQVLITGGVIGSSLGLSADMSAETYDPAGKTFTSAGSMNEARAFHTATALLNGQILIVGGFGRFFGTTVNGGNLSGLFGSNLNSAEIYDSVAGTFACINGNGTGGFVCGPSMKRGRGAHTATLFESGPLMGQVLIAGGLGAKKPNSTATELNEAELFNPSGNTFSQTRNLKTARGLHSAVLLP